MTDDWHDTYDWIEETDAYIPKVGMVPDNSGDSLEKEGRAKGFDMKNRNVKKINEKGKLIPLIDNILN